jgi:hypothetical protein
MPDYTPTILTVLATLGAALFTTVISQYFFAPWLEVRKEILIKQARGRAQIADEAREFVRELRKLQLVRDSFVGTRRFSDHWEKAMREYRTRLDDFGHDFPHLAVPFTRQVSNLITATKWSLEVVYFRKLPENSPIDDVAFISLQLSQATDPTTFPLKRPLHARRGLTRYKKLMKSINDIPFGD